MEDARKRDRPVDTGGPPCDEAQSDGVPCEDLERDCGDCERAEPEAREVYKARAGDTGRDN
jgi:hypothetical protein